jgi:hypothetical protein
MSEVKKIKAKDFMLQLRPEDKSLKIGFGEYFYEQDQEISITEEFSLRILRKIENLQIDDKKKTAEFDSLFKGAQTHFVIKEVYEGTLNIMKFIKSYNEKPFPIKSQYEDEISIVIDKEGYNLSLRKPNCENSIYLFNTNKGSFFQIYFPEPPLRFMMKSCEVTGRGLYIQHDTLDLYSNERTEKTEFNWDFDIQPEMRELIIEFMKIALNMSNE